MCELANDLLRDALARSKLAVSRNLSLAGLIVQFEQYPRIERGSPTVDVQLAPCNTDFQCSESNRYAAGLRPFAKLDQLIGTCQDLVQTMAERLALTEAKEILGREVEKRDDKMLVERD
jgi:hypothetical protein